MDYNEKTKTLTVSTKTLKNKIIPEETKIIIFKESSGFNQRIFKLPQNITHIIFCNSFNKNVNKLPKKLTHLTFGNNFNHKIDFLSKYLTHLVLGNYFQQKVEHLPQNLIYLSITNYYCCHTINKLPKNLIYFKINRICSCGTFKKKINFPKNLKYLQIGWFSQNEIILPKNIKELSLTCNNNLINNIPKHIEKVYIYFNDGDNNNRFIYNKKVENLPLTIKEIVIQDEKYKEYIKIPFGCILTIQKTVLNELLYNNINN
jgi:hypothetical protein